jgi:putative transposase
VRIWLATLPQKGVELHNSTYYQLKAVLIDLPTQLICAARVKAAEALKSAFARLKANRKTSQPRSKLCPIRYDQRSYWVKWATNQTSLASVSGRQIIGFDVPDYAAKYAGYPVDSADLLYRKGRFWLHVVVTLPDPSYTTSGEVIGVDLGLNHPAVTSQRKFLGKRRWKGIDRRYFRLKRSLQSKGTKSARRHLRKLAGRLQRFRTDCDHVLSKQIVQSAESGATIVVENLSEIRSRVNQRGRENRRRLHSWSFAQLRAFLTYKAQEAGMRVVAIDPRYTSQTCSKCGFQSRSNRKTQALFLCGACNYQLNADLNAAYNIRDKHHASLGIALAGGPQSIGLTYPALVVEVQAAWL